MLAHKIAKQILILTCFFLLGCKESNKVETPEKEIPSGVKEEVLKLKNDDVVLGNPEAKVQIVEYFSLTCHHCADFHKKVFAPFKENYIDKGLVGYTARLLPFDKQAFHGSILVRCAPKEQYYNFINVLLEQQNNWVFSKDFQEILTQIGQIGGVAHDKFAQCLEDPVLKEQILKQVQEATKLGIDATPEIYINGKSYRNNNVYEDFSKAVDEAIENSK
jgi:protein-disulfide isomerase